MNEIQFMFEYFETKISSLEDAYTWVHTGVLPVGKITRTLEHFLMLGIYQMGNFDGFFLFRVPEIFALNKLIEPFVLLSK